MYDARLVGVNYLVAPMVESALALQKYLRAIDTVFPDDEKNEIEFLINLETIRAVQQFDEMLNIKEISKLNGIVVGRVDLVGSMGFDRKSVNSEKVFAIILDVLKKAKERNMSCVVGGAIAVDSLPFLRAIPEGLIDRYETRKICFLCKQALGSSAEKGLLKAISFELLWLKNKRNFYKAISEEDDKRITMLELRLNQ
jgi:hypothetical protein